MEPVICNTVGELIEALKKYPPDTIPSSPNPPFCGVKVVPQGDGRLLLAAPREQAKDEDCFGLKREAA